ncbi:hypothetical protein M3Y99_01143400 [Aphelenchoides fujianensis]|nr:hypothetical protein M3Y99_01143400 [Aphelenchoides fujianensis]
MLCYDGTERKAIQMVECFMTQTINEVSTPPPARATRKRKKSPPTTVEQPARTKRTKRSSRISSGYESSGTPVVTRKAAKRSTPPAAKEQKSSSKKKAAEKPTDEAADKENAQPNAVALVTPVSKTHKTPTNSQSQGSNKQSQQPVIRMDLNDFAESPTGRPWKDIVKSKRERMPAGKRRSSIPPVRTRHSTRLAGEHVVEEPPLSRENQLIRQRMDELQQVDNRELKRRLKEQGKQTVTPDNKGRVTYDLMNPASINRKFIDDQAEYFLEEGLEPGTSEFLQRPGLQFLAGDL